ncbi:MAG: hypothetical protein SPF70_03945 [Lachnospiraceae bacterium]|nr:hypothetical protein [Lachnospiraceae bacterium]
MRGLYKLLVAFAMFAISTATYAQLSDEERYELMSKVKAEYEMSNIDGTKILKVKNKYVLVDLEIMQSTMKEAYQARAAKIKATRTMGEFLNGAKNESESAYETRNKEGEIFDKKQTDNQSMKGAFVESETSSSIKEGNISSSIEEFSDKDIQKAKSKLGEIQSLMKFKGPEGETVYCYFLLLAKSKVKKKY